jgi:hypothetical protein
MGMRGTQFILQQITLYKYGTPELGKYTSYFNYLIVLGVNDDIE